MEKHIYNHKEYTQLTNPEITGYVPDVDIISDIRNKDVYDTLHPLWYYLKDLSKSNCSRDSDTYYGSFRDKIMPNGDIIQVCLALSVSITQLNNKINSLTKEIDELKIMNKKND